MPWLPLLLSVALTARQSVSSFLSLINLFTVRISESDIGPWIEQTTDCINSIRTVTVRLGGVFVSVFILVKRHPGDTVRKIRLCHPIDPSSFGSPR